MDYFILLVPATFRSRMQSQALHYEVSQFPLAPWPPKQIDLMAAGAVSTLR